MVLSCLIVRSWLLARFVILVVGWDWCRWDSWCTLEGPSVFLAVACAVPLGRSVLPSSVFEFLLPLLALSFLPSLVLACLRIFRGCACSLGVLGGIASVCGLLVLFFFLLGSWTVVWCFLWCFVGCLGLGLLRVRNEGS